MKTVQIFYNDKSGKNDKKQLVDQLIDYLVAHGFEATHIQCVSPESVEDAYRLAKEASQQRVDIVVAVGGDGTINKIAGGIFDGGAHSTLAILPAGSVNNFAKSLDFSMDMSVVFQYIVDGRTKQIDLSQANKTYMISSLTIGLLADIAASVKSSEKRKLGVFAFLKKAWPIMRRNRSYYLQVTIDGVAHHIKTKFLLVSTTKSIGGMTNFHPDAKVDDGILRLYTMENYSFWRFFHYWFAIHRGEFKNLPEIHYFKAQEIAIVVQKNRRFQSVRTRIDGDKSERLPVTIKIHPKALNVIVPPEQSH